jgi:hypothetical protein
MNNVVFTQQDIDKLDDIANFEVTMKFGQYKDQVGFGWYMKGKPDTSNNWGNPHYYYGKTKKGLLNYYNNVHNKTEKSS